MKKIVLLLLLISNITFAQDYILAPHKIVEGYIEKNEEVDSLHSILKYKNRIINKQDQEINLANEQVKESRIIFDTYEKAVLNRDTIISNKNQEIRYMRKENIKTKIKLGGIALLEFIGIVTLLILFL